MTLALGSDVSMRFTRFAPMKPDAPGSYIAWLCGQTQVHAMEMPGSRYDIGNLESYEAVKRDYKGITK